jgi:hypothetical protein
MIMSALRAMRLSPCFLPSGDATAQRGTHSFLGPLLPQHFYLSTPQPASRAIHFFVDGKVEPDQLEDGVAFAIQDGVVFSETSCVFVFVSPDLPFTGWTSRCVQLHNSE